MKINNLEKGHLRWVVARLVNGEFWYWGSWNTEDKAREIARRLGDCAGVFDMNKEVI